MQIKLTDNAPPMWFLGQPGKIKISLNFTNPGPVEIDFSKLTHEEQKKILVDLQDGKISSDVDFASLYQQWATNKPSIPEPPTQVKEYLQHQKLSREQSKRLKATVDRQKREEKFQERVAYLSKKNAKSIRAALKDENDIRLVRALLDAELARKRIRASVKDFLEEMLRKLQKEIVINIESSENKPSIHIPKHLVPEETISFDVVESEQEVIQFTPEDLINSEADTNKSLS